ncbi:MAG: glycoside hydrolase [Lentisphaerae bacterium]|nr:glycoside hydrolase [Lentisphaerota bacterium]
MQTTEKTGRKIFIQAGQPVGLIGGDDGRMRQEGDTLVVLPDERWGNPVYADSCLDECDFHIHARLTLDQLAGSGASVLLGGHYHYSHSRPEGNCTFRIVLDEDTAPANKQSLDKPMYIVHGMANPLKRHWSLEANRSAKQVVGKSLDFIRPGEPFTIDIFRRGTELTFEINGRVAFSISLSDGASGISPGRCGDTGWPISVGFLPGHAPLRIHEFWAEGCFTGPARATSDVWYLNTGGYTHYRIPSLCMTSGGRLLAFTEARLSRLSRGWEWEYALVKDEVHCLMKHSDDQGRTWSEPQVVIERGTSYEARDPGPVLDRDTGEIFLITGKAPWLISSRDDGRTWSDPRSLAAAAPGKFQDFRPGVGNCAIQLRHGPQRGRLLLALYISNAVCLIYSDDHGRTWQPGALSAYNRASEPTLVECSDGRVILSPRLMSSAPGRLFMISHDGGETIAETRFESAIPIPGQGELVAVDLAGAGATEARRALVFCGSAEDKTRLTLIASLDDGRTWPIKKELDDGPCANLALVALPEGQVGILYETDKYLRQRFMRVDLSALLDT